MEITKRDQELLATGAKMKTLEEQHQDYQRHIAVLKESLCAKEEHYNMLQTDVSPDPAARLRRFHCSRAARWRSCASDSRRRTGSSRRRRRSLCRRPRSAIDSAPS